MELLKSKLVIELSNGEAWQVDVEVIVKNRISACGTPGNFFEAFQETEELFKDSSEIEDWAKNNMRWHELKATRIEDACVDYDELWGEAEVTLLNE